VHKSGRKTSIITAITGPVLIQNVSAKDLNFIVNRNKEKKCIVFQEQS